MTGGYAYAVTCPTRDRCVAVGGGSQGRVWTSSDGGRRWTIAAVPAGVAQLDDVSCATATTCIAVGPGSRSAPGDILRTLDGGRSWRGVAYGPRRILLSVACATARDCWSVSGGIEVSHDAGATWSNQAFAPCFPNSGTPRTGCFGLSLLTHVLFASPSAGWIVGVDQCGGAGRTQCPGGVLHTSEGGAHWQFLLPRRTDRGEVMPQGNAIACPTADRCLMLASTYSTARVLVTTDGGATWTTVPLPRELAQGVDIRCIDARSCVVTGWSLGGAPRGAVAVTTTGGRSWKELTVPADIQYVQHGVCSTTSCTFVANTATEGELISTRVLGSAPVSTLLGIPTPGAALTAKNIALAAVITLLLMLIVAFPSTLFNATLEANLDRLRNRLPRWLRPKARDHRLRPTIWHTRRGFAIYLVAAAILYSRLAPPAGVGTPRRASRSSASEWRPGSRRSSPSG